MLFMFVIGGYSQTQSKCFEYGGLKDKNSISLQINGSKVTGTYSIDREYSGDAMEDYEFTGTKTGNIVKATFAKYTSLPAPPYEIKSMTLTLVQAGDVESAKAIFAGKKKPSVYSMRMDSCEPSYATLLKTAKRVLFAKGTSSATV